jgi:hypothetical protein
MLQFALFDIIVKDQDSHLINITAIVGRAVILPGYPPKELATVLLVNKPKLGLSARPYFLDDFFLVHGNGLDVNNCAK